MKPIPQRHLVLAKMFLMCRHTLMGQRLTERNLPALQNQNIMEKEQKEDF